MSILNGLSARGETLPDAGGDEFRGVLAVAARCSRQREDFESRIGFEALVEVMTNRVSLPQVTSGIDTYRTVIRRNSWMYPTVAGRLADLDLFVDVWETVHCDYHEVAQDIFVRLAEHGEPALSDPGLYERIVQSETSRGWVGKRSPIGPDQQTEKRVATIESLLQGSLDAEAIDTVLDVGGALPGVRGIVSAEEDLTALLAGAMPSVESRIDISSRRVLRDYAKYNRDDFVAKLAAVGSAGSSGIRVTPSIETLLESVSQPVRTEVTDLLREIRVLNFVNLNLEPRFSFKSWAGLMHGLVFAAVRAIPGMSDDVYGNLSTLKGTK